MWLYGIAKFVARLAYSLAFRIRVEGLENIPQEGGLILCGNHSAGSDPIVLGITCPRRVNFMAKAELFDIPGVGFLIRSLGAFPVKRGRPDRAALRRSIEVLESGGCFGIFPEGTRSRTGKLGKAEPGTAYLAIKSGATMVPVGVSGTYKLFSPITVRYGKPVDLDRFRSGKLSSRGLEEAGEVIMAAIGALLEPPVLTSSAAENGSEE